MVKVVKFGGSSVANAEQFQKVKHIITADPERRIVVTSASGKVDKEDHKITDLLYLCYEHKKYGMTIDPIFDLVRAKLVTIAKELSLAPNIESELDELYQSILEGMEREVLVSRGEYLTAKLLSDYLGYTFVDAKDIIFFRYDKELDEVKTEDAFKKALEEHPRMVVPGFYGALPDGSISLMTRGGSDITGSILAHVSDAERYENWTDVSGILKADPRIVPTPKQIDVISYEELRELSYMGFSVIHEEAVYPIKKKNIPIHILNTNEPNNQGTIILNSVDTETSGMITGVAGKKDFSILTMVKEHLFKDVWTIRKALDVLEHYHIPVEQIATGIDTFSFVIQTRLLKPLYHEIVHHLYDTCQIDRVTVLHEKALITTVSRFMKNKTGMSGRLFKTLGEREINIAFISQTSDEMNIILGVDNDRYEETIQAIYDEFEGEKRDETV